VVNIMGPHGILLEDYEIPLASNCIPCNCKHKFLDNIGKDFHLRFLSYLTQFPRNSYGPMENCTNHTESVICILKRGK